MEALKASEVGTNLVKLNKVENTGIFSYQMMSNQWNG